MRDIRKRTGETSAVDAAKRLLEASGIPLPEGFELTAADVPVIPSRQAKQHDPEARRARMLELGWPLRAVDFAMVAHETPALKAARAWRTTHESLVLAGPKGTGKTVAAAWLALNWHMSATFRFTRAAKLVRLGRFGEAWAEFVDAPALCIDDLGAEYVDVKGSFVADLDELIDTFYSSRRPLIVTTNLGGQEFRERYGVRVFDRFTECATWTSVEGPSLREREPWEG